MTKNKCSCKKSKNLVFYYTVDQNAGTLSSKITFGTSVLETINGNIYSNSDLTNIIGRFVIVETVCDINDVNIKNVNQTIAQVSFYLQDGNIQITVANQLYKDSQDDYILGNKIKNRIINGTNKYLDSKGYVTIKPTDMFRKVKIQFKK